MIADANTETAQIAADLGVRGMVADLTDEGAVRQALGEACDGGDLTFLVNCGGISPKKKGRKRPIAEIDLEEWERVLRVNVTSPFLLIRESLATLGDHAGAAIVNVISINHKLGTGGPEGSEFGPFFVSGAHYAASKAALANLTLSVSRELAPRGIRCNGVSPGVVGTGMREQLAPEVETRLVGQVPLGRVGTTDEIASVVEFLVSDGAAYITGEIIDVDGGWCPD
jgi:NAD(P)-dependent dehydrogenase (short-subunit alcohol dehydrogenase family)